jgi:hypothetical protein
MAHKVELPLDAPALAPKSLFIERGFRRKMAVPASLSGKFSRRKKGEPLVPHGKIKRARFHGIFRDRMPPHLERLLSSRCKRDLFAAANLRFSVIPPQVRMTG